MLESTAALWSATLPSTKSVLAWPASSSSSPCSPSEYGAAQGVGRPYTTGKRYRPVFSTSLSCFFRAHCSYLWFTSGPQGHVSFGCFFKFFYSLLMNSVLCSSLNVITRPLPPQLIAVLIKSPVPVFIRRRGLFSSNAEVWVLPRRELFTLQ